MGSDVGQEIIQLARDNWSVAKDWSRDEADLAWLGLQTMCISTFALFVTARCWANMLTVSSEKDAKAKEPSEDSEAE